ncbi:hypothetical protein J2S74_000262 [Evansella vedderi]|uniref:Uncharacterized protein n=1 Tax=Evansella vedderi TaxID=38282 RepID=A0ABT9ZPL1_9BACI|nr:hypothetical protein [Evansella vedderi]
MLPRRIRFNAMLVEEETGIIAEDPEAGSQDGNITQLPAGRSLYLGVIDPPAYNGFEEQN